MVVIRMRIVGLSVWLLALLAPVDLPAAEARPRSVLVLDQSDRRGPFDYRAFSALRAEVTADLRSPVTLYFHELNQPLGAIDQGRPRPTAAGHAEHHDQQHGGDARNALWSRVDRSHRN
jgi:hypothetical protein